MCSPTSDLRHCYVCIGLFEGLHVVPHLQADVPYGVQIVIPELSRENDVYPGQYVISARSSPR